MCTRSPLAKLIPMLVVFTLVLAASHAVSQKRGKARQRSDSPAATKVDEGDKLVDEKKYAEAIDVYKAALALDANYAPAQGGLGDAYFNSGDSEQALTAYKEEARLAPNDPRAQYDLGSVYVKVGKIDLAREQLRKLSTADAMLALRLESEIRGSAQPITQSQPKPAESPIVDKPAPRKADSISAQTQTTAASQPSPAPSTSPAATEQTSRQLQQLPPVTQPPPPSNTPATATTDQVASLPPSAKRWALVIGVDKYIDPQISPLKGSDNDARLIADALVRYSGFPRDQVILLATDQPVERQPTRVNILRRLSNLSTTVPKDGLLLVSFAGHGMERGGQAFLLPADAQISDQISFLEETAISMTRVKSWIKETGVGQVVLLLDACRNDPGGRADAPNNLSNTYVNAFNFDVRNKEVQAFATIYATGIGQRAYEYTEKKQGYFSWAVVEALKGGAANDKGEVTLSQLVKYVQDAVPKQIAIDLGSTKQQKPFAVIEGYRADELVLAVTSGAANSAANVPPTIATVDPAAIELAYWDTIKNSNNPDDFKAYLEKYPDGQFAALAKSRAQATRPAVSTGGADSVEMVYWNAIKDSHNPSDFRAYIKKFPNGLFVELANSRITTLEAEAREAARVRTEAEAADRARNSHVFDVKDASGTDGSLTVTPGALGFEPKKANPKKNVTLQCSEIRRVEAGQSALQPPHVNLYVRSAGESAGGKKAGGDRTIVFYTSSGGPGLFVNKPVVNITNDVINAIIEACRMARVNK